MRVVVTPANLSDQEGARRLLEQPDDRMRHLELIWADQGYQSTELSVWVERTVAAELVITGRTAAGFWLKPGEPLPETNQAEESGRWPVERSFAWVGRCRRLAKDYEYLPETEEAFCYLAMAHLLLKRLTR
jgi:transposase